MAVNISIPTPNASTLALSGAKTYIVAIAAIAYALYGYFVGHTMTADEAAAFMLSGAGGAAVRAAIAKGHAFAADHTEAIDAARAEVLQLKQLVLSLQAQATLPIKAPVPAPPPSMPFNVAPAPAAPPPPAGA